MTTPPLTTIAGTATHYLKSPSHEHELQIDVSLPYGYEDGTQNYPVVYLIDSYWFFPIVSASVLPMQLGKELPGLIVVGIGYKPAGLSRMKENERAGHLRLRDLTPSHDPSDWWNMSPAGKAPPPEIEPGQADNFLELIERDVKPFVAERYRVDREDETLAGFSLGGLITMHAFFRHTEKFDRFLAGSPSLWWHQEKIFEVEEDFAAKNKDVDKALFFSMGDLEEAEAYAAYKMVTNLKRMADRFAARDYPLLKWESMIQEEESHSSNWGLTFSKGLRALFRMKPARSGLGDVI